MAKCDTCGNDYDTPLRIRYNNHEYVFDSFECAIHKLAPRCAHCGCRIIGHGVGSGGQAFCCEGCAARSGLPIAASRRQDRGD